MSIKIFDLTQEAIDRLSEAFEAEWVLHIEKSNNWEKKHLYDVTIHYTFEIKASVFGLDIYPDPESVPGKLFKDVTIHVKADEFSSCSLF